MASIKPVRIIVACLVLAAFAASIAVVRVVLITSRDARRQEAAIELLRDVDELNRSIAQAFLEFELTLGPALNGDADVDASTVERALRTLDRTVSQAISAISRRDRSSIGSDYVAAERGFLLQQRRIIRERCGRIVDALKDRSISDADRSQEVQRVGVGAFVELKEQVTTIQSARRSFVEQFKINVE